MRDFIKQNLVPGKKIKIFFNPGNINNKLIHVRAIVDNDQVVFRWWSKVKKYWVYEIRDMIYFVYLDHGEFLYEG